MTILENKMEKKKINHLYNSISKKTDETDSIIELVDYELPQSSAKLNISITRPDITKIRGVGPSVAEKLRSAGFTSIEQIANSSISQLTAIRGIGHVIAQKIVEDANSLLHRKNLNDFPDARHAAVFNPSPAPIQPLESDVIENEIVPEDGEEFEEYDIPDLPEEVPIREIVYEPEPPRAIPLSPRREIVKPSLKIANEKLSTEEKREIVNKVVAHVQALGYEIMKTTPMLRKIYSLVDVVAFKVISVNEFLDLILIVPIKVSNLRGELHVSNKMIKYLPIDQDVSEGSIYKTLLDSCFSQLKECQTLIYEELKEERNLIPYLKRFHNVDITLKKTLLKRNLSFTSGNLQIKILLEPIILSENRIGFLEKVIPFAYLKDINLHIIQASHLSELLRFLEQKYTLLETHSTQDTSLVSYEDSKNRLLRRIELFSVPFMGFAGFLILMLTLKSFEILTYLLNFGYACFGIYIITLLYFNMKFFKHKTDLQQEFSTPYHKRELTFDETSLVLINEEFTPEMMPQFVFECIGKNAKSKFIIQMEEQQIREKVSTTQFVSKVKNEAFFEKEEKEPENEFVAKYSSFLED
jgi:hypothetical protein